MTAPAERAAQPFSIGHLALRNRIVGTAHGRGMLRDGLALPEDADYWRRGRRRGSVDGDRRRHRHRSRIDVAAQDRHRGVARGGDRRTGSARAGHPGGGCGGGLSARPSRPGDDGSRDVVPARSPVRGPLAPRADSPTRVDGHRDRRGDRGLSHLRGERRARRLPGRRAPCRTRLPACAVPVRVDEPPSRRRVGPRARVRDPPGHRGDPRGGSRSHPRHQAIHGRRGTEEGSRSPDCASSCRRSHRMWTT